jgi:hypothetical protein
MLPLTAMIPIAISLPTIFARLHSAGAIGFAVVVLAIYFVVVTAIEKWRVHRTRKWPTVPGATTEVHTEFISGGINGVDYWRVHFVYVYSVNGTEYRGKYHVNCVSEGLSKDATAGIAKGPATVHYDPANPVKSVLWEDEVWNLW